MVVWTWVSAALVRIARLVRSRAAASCRGAIDTAEAVVASRATPNALTVPRSLMASVLASRFSLIGQVDIQASVGDSGCFLE
ncbi:hypothetical protein HYQ46_001066 [Verticillium longisporum]|nr:hypothetical protein HYQ46_001066 [Verticillium longisporum]